MRLTRRDLLNAKNGAILQFSGEDNDVGKVSFNNNLALSSSSPVTMSMQQTFNIDGADAYFSNNLNTSGSLNVASAANLANTLTVTQGATLQGTLNVTGESTFAANTTVSGTLKADSDLDISDTGGHIKAGTVNALTINGSGEVTKIGQDTPSQDEYLKWDGSKAVWAPAAVTSLSLDAISAGSNANNRVQTTGNLHLDSTSGELFLSSSDDFAFISSDSSATITFNNGVVTDSAGKGQICKQVVNRGSNKSLTQIYYDGLFIRSKNNDSSNADGLGVVGAEIINRNTYSNNHPLHIGTKNLSVTDQWGQNVTGSLVFSATDRRFIFCDNGKSSISSGTPQPFFHVKKIRDNDNTYQTSFEVELNATKGTSNSFIPSWNTSFTHSTFLKFNQDGKITKLGHDTPTDGQVLSWDNSNGCITWSDASTGSETLAGLTDTNVSSPSDGDYLKYNASTSKWEPVTGPASATYSSKTANFTAEFDYYYSINTTSSSVLITLPEIVAANIGKKIIIKFKAGTLELKAVPHSGETIEGDNNFIFSPSQSPGQSITLISDGNNNWEII